MEQEPTLVGRNTNLAFAPGPEIRPERLIAMAPARRHSHREAAVYRWGGLSGKGRE